MPSEAGQWAVFIARCLTAVVAVAVLVLGGLVQLEVFKPSKFLAIVLIGALALFTLIDNVRTAYQTVKATRRQDAVARIAMTVMGMTNAVAHQCGLTTGVVGGSVFVAKKRWILRSHIIFVIRTTVLVRPPQWRIRYADGPQPSRVVWTTEKGAIGQAFRSGSIVYKYWAAIAERHGGRNGSIDSTSFTALSNDVKSGFAHTEFVSIVGKYAEILAVPIMSVDGGKVLGVFAIDRPYRADEPPQMLFDCSAVADSVERVAGLIRDDL